MFLDNHLLELHYAHRAQCLRRDHGDRYASGDEVFRRPSWRARDPVAHTLRPGGKAQDRV